VIRRFSRWWVWAALATAVSLVVGVWLVRGAHVYAHDNVITDPAACPGDIRFAVIGDYGYPGQAAADVAALVKSWNADFIVTLGDNNYPAGAAATIDYNIGQYYSDFIFPYVGQYGTGAAENRFFSALGNHDLDTDLGQPYFDYFSLPGNERYYDFVEGPIHFFMLNSDPREPDGRSADSVQAQWLKKKLAASNAPWKLVILHHTPYTSSLKRRPDAELQWPFTAWGATAVLSGHDHLYERLAADGIPYIVNGAGGKTLNLFGRAEPESIVRYNQDHGAMQVHAAPDCLNFTFYNRKNKLIDSITLTP
jgi:tartrate-resistant acid phosphatase type 5